MSFDRPTPHEFLAELMRRTQGDSAVKISMYEAGAALGLGKPEAGKLAEEVIAQGWAEIKTLSGDIGITADGIAVSGAATVADTPAHARSLGKGPVVTDEGRTSVEKILEQIKTAMEHLSLPYETCEEIVMDLKTAQLQLLSPKPKTAVIKAVLDSLQAAMKTAGAADIASRIEALVHD